MLLSFWTSAFNFSGKISRKGFWQNYLTWLALPSLIAGVINFLLQENMIASTALFEKIIITLAFYFFIALIPSISLTVRRLHDLNKSGWYFLVHFIPFIGTLILLVVLAFPSVPNTTYQ